MQPRIAALTNDQAPANSRTQLEQVGKALGMVPNLHRSLAHSPSALRAYMESTRALAGGRLSAALRERIAVATAATNGCGYCASAHTALGKGVGLDEDELRRNQAARSSDEKSAAALAFARDLIESRGAVSDARFEALRAAGFDDSEIVEIVAHVAHNAFTNLFNVFNRTEIDFPVVQLAQAG